MNVALIQVHILQPMRASSAFRTPVKISTLIMTMCFGLRACQTAS
jgi:hypothetical protein